MCRTGQVGPTTRHPCEKAGHAQHDRARVSGTAGSQFFVSGNRPEVRKKWSFDRFIRGVNDLAWTTDDLAPSSMPGLSLRSWLGKHERALTLAKPGESLNPAPHPKPQEERQMKKLLFVVDPLDQFQGPRTPLSQSCVRPSGAVTHSGMPAARHSVEVRRFCHGHCCSKSA